MMIAASVAISSFIPQEELNPEYIIPSPLNREVHERVAVYVRQAALKSGVSQLDK